MISWLVLKLESTYNRVIINILKDFGFLLEDFFFNEDYIFTWVNYLNFS